MKTSFLSLKAGTAFIMVCLSAIILFASCSKNNDPMPEPIGDAKVRYVNAVQGSLGQDLYVNGIKKSEEAVTYGEVSDYLTITSGNNTFALYNTGSATANATSQSYNFPIGISGTVFYYQAPNGPMGAFAIGDDMSAPATGKAKVRFLNINQYSATNAISVSVVGAATPLIPSLIYGDLDNASYLSVDPGVKFKFTMTGVTDAPEVDGEIVAGKNYTIWIDGSSAANLTGHVILQN